MALKITRLIAENIKNIRAVDITPDDNLVIISGKNNQGKSSVLDAIWLALDPASAKKTISNPIRKGEKFASCILDLDEYIVKRTFKLNDNGEEITVRLTVENANGDTVKKRPQELLDSFIGSLSFDPLEFMKMDGKKRRQLLADIVGLNLADFEAKKAKLIEERKDLKKEKNALERIVESIAPPTDNEQIHELSSQQIVDELGLITQNMYKVERLTKHILDREKEIYALHERLSVLEQEQDVDKENLKTLGQINWHDQYIAIKQKLENIEAHNKRAVEINKYNNAIQLRLDIDEKLNNIESQILSLEKEQISIIKNTELPIVGLTMSDDDILFNTFPIADLCTSDQIKICVALGMAINPRLKVIRIKDGSLLDKDNLDLIRRLAKDQDYQIWVECVDDSGKLGFVIEDGSVLLNSSDTSAKS